MVVSPPRAAPAAEEPPPAAAAPPPPQPGAEVEARYDDGGFARATVQHKTSTHTTVKFHRLEATWESPVLAEENDTLARIAYDKGYLLALLWHANQDVIQDPRWKFKPNTLVLLPYVVIAANDETPAQIARRHGVKADDVVSCTKKAYELIPEDAPPRIAELQPHSKLEPGTQILLPEYHRPCDESALMLPRRSGHEEPVECKARARPSCCALRCVTPDTTYLQVPFQDKPALGDKIWVSMNDLSNDPDDAYWVEAEVRAARLAQGLLDALSLPPLTCCGASCSAGFRGARRRELQGLRGRRRGGGRRAEVRA